MQLALILLASYLKLLVFRPICLCFEIRANSYSRNFSGNTIRVSGKGLASTVTLALTKSFYDNINSESCLTTCKLAALVNKHYTG